jgi:hypothetical protein
MTVTLYDPARCPHEWVLPGILMPEGYWKPTGPITCRWCGAWQHVKMTTTIIGAPITGTLLQQVIERDRGDE